MRGRAESLAAQRRLRNLTTVHIEFRRTGERRYAVLVHCADQRTLQMDPAPGYDALMPHDLLHYAVECELGLQAGIFGQLAQGGHARLFHPVADASSGKRQLARERRRGARRDERIAHREDSAESEAAVHAYGEAWRRRARDAKNTPVEPRFARLCSRLDGLSEQWRKLRVGESMTVCWPDTSLRRRAARPALQQG